MLNFVISLFLGMIPEVLYFTLFIIFTKKVETKRIRLFLLLALGYILLIMICRYQLYFYLGYIVYSYLVLKYLYKSEIIDFFMCSIGLFYMTIVSFILYKLLSYNYVLYYVIERITLYLIFIFKNKFNDLYLKYASMWNRNRESKNKVKSLTLRNSSLLFLNIFIIALNGIIVYILSIIS